MAGRPLKFETPDILEEKINEYFKQCEEKGLKPLITELALHLGTTRETLCDYNEKDEYSDSIKKAKLRCQVALERNLVEGKVNPTGTIFNLKNNYGWRDKNETDITTQGEKIQSGVVILPQKNESSLETTTETSTGTSEN